jgi:hypothetical protein
MRTGNKMGLIGDKFINAVCCVSAPNFSKKSDRELYDFSLFKDAQKHWQYSLSLRDALIEVMCDEDHHALVEVGRVLNYDLPNYDDFIDEVAAYTEFIQEAEAGLSKKFSFVGNSVRVSSKDQAIMGLVMEYNKRFTTELLKNILHTQYMERVRERKQLDIPYQGPTALQEILSVNVTQRALEARLAEVDLAPSKGTNLRFLRL